MALKNCKIVVYLPRKSTLSPITRLTMAGDHLSAELRVKTNTLGVQVAIHFVMNY